MDVKQKGDGGMDNMYIRLPLIKRILSKIIERAIRKKLGYSVDICLNEVIVTFDGEKAHVHLNADADMSKEELAKIIKKAGL